MLSLSVFVLFAILLVLRASRTEIKPVVDFFRGDSHRLPFTPKGTSRMRWTGSIARDKPSNSSLPKHIFKNNDIHPSRARTSLTLAIGISVTKRSPPTIYNLLEEMSAEEIASDTIIVVHVSFDVSSDEKLLQRIRSYEERLAMKVIVEKSLYPQAQTENIKNTNGDSLERAVWRTKQGTDCRL